MTPDHQCICRECAPEAFPKLDPNNPSHKSVYFGAHGRDVERVLICGQDVTTATEEAIAGDEGMVVLVRQDLSKKPGSFKAHLCQNCMVGACKEVRHGRVEIILKAIAAQGN